MRRRNRSTDITGMSDACGNLHIQELQENIRRLNDRVLEDAGEGASARSQKSRYATGVDSGFPTRQDVEDLSPVATDADNGWYLVSVPGWDFNAGGSSGSDNPNAGGNSGGGSSGGGSSGGGPGSGSGGGYSGCGCYCAECLCGNHCGGPDCAYGSSGDAPYSGSFPVVVNPDGTPDKNANGTWAVDKVYLYDPPHWGRRKKKGYLTIASGPIENGVAVGYTSGGSRTRININ